MGDDAVHGPEARDYRAASGTRLAVTAYVADITEKMGSPRRDLSHQQSEEGVDDDNTIEASLTQHNHHSQQPHHRRQKLRPLPSSSLLSPPSQSPTSEPLTPRSALLLTNASSSNTGECAVKLQKRGWISEAMDAIGDLFGCGTCHGNEDEEVVYVRVIVPNASEVANPSGPAARAVAPNLPYRHQDPNDVNARSRRALLPANASRSNTGECAMKLQKRGWIGEAMDAIGDLFGCGTCHGNEDEEVVYVRDIVPNASEVANSSGPAARAVAPNLPYRQDPNDIHARSRRGIMRRARQSRSPSSQQT